MHFLGAVPSFYCCSYPVHYNYLIWAGNFSLHHRVQNGSGAHSASCPMGTGALSLGVKLTTHLHLVPRSRVGGAIPPLPQYIFMAWCLVKHRNNFTFTLPHIVQYTADLTSWIDLYALFHHVIGLPDVPEMSLVVCSCRNVCFS
jgi:hypothetical protein